MNKSGFTVIELLITVVMMIILFGSVGYLYQSCFSAIDLSEGRVQARTQLSQAVDLISSELYNAVSITTCNATTLTFQDNSGKNYTFQLSGNTLEEPTSNAMIASNVQPQGTSVSWGTTPALFKCTNIPVSGIVPTAPLVTIDMTAINNGSGISSTQGETVHIQTTVQPRNMPVGLDAWWSSAVADSSGNGNSGTANNISYYYSSSPPWYAAYFNGTNAYVYLGGLTITNSVTAATWSVWVNPVTLSNYSDIITKTFTVVNPGGPTLYWYHFILTLNSSGAVYVYTPTSTSDYSTYGHTANGVISTGSWSNIVAVYNGSLTGNSNKLQIYVNGSLQTLTFSGTVPASLDNSIGNYEIGAETLGNFYKGYMTDVRVYNRALSQDEISQLSLRE